MEQSVIKVDNDSHVAWDSSDEDDPIVLNSKMTNIISSNRQEHLKVNLIGKLLQKGADINFMDANRKNDTPLHLAVRKRNLKLTEFLLENNAIYAENNDKKFPLDLARDLQYMDIVAIFSKEEEKKSMQQPTKLDTASKGNLDDIKSHKDNILNKHAFANKHMQETYKKTPGGAGAGGHFFEINLLTLFKLRGDKYTEEFYLAGNMGDAGAFDDVVFKFVESNGGQVQVVFLQAKHKEVGAKENLTIEKMKKEGDFYLHKYFQSYLGIKNKFSETSVPQMFRGVFASLNCYFVIHTNGVLDSKFEMSRIIDANDELSSIVKTGNRGNVFKLNVACPLNDDVISMLVKTARSERIKSLANTLMNGISSGKLRNIMCDENIQIYHVFLAKTVIEIDLQKQSDMESQSTTGDKLLWWKFRDEFLEGEFENEQLSEFRMAIFKACAENELTCRKSETPTFESENGMRIACRKIAQLLQSSKTKTIEIQDLVGPDLIAIICKLTGNVIVYKKETGDLEFSEDRSMKIRDKEIISEIKKCLTGNSEISKFRFKISELIIKLKLKEKSFSLPIEFGNVRPHFKNPADVLSKRFVDLCEGKSGNVFKIERIDNSLAKDIRQLVGNLFQVNETNGFLRFADNIVFDVSVNEIWDKLKAAMVESGYDLQTNFDISITNFPRLSLGYVAEYETCTRDFLKKLIICTGQPDESKLEEIIITEMARNYRLTEAEAKSTYNNLNNAMKKWWKKKDVADYLKKGDGFLNDIVKFNIRFDLKPPVISFTGRTTELRILHTLLQTKEMDDNANTYPQMVCISGLGGIGKSDMARKYAEEYGHFYDSNVIWIDAESMEKVSTSFRKLCQDKLSIKTKTEDDLEKSIASLVEEVYSFFQSRKCLFIFDNAESYKSDIGNNGLSLQDFLQHSNPIGSSNPYFIITSCNQIWPCKTLPLDTLTDDEAEEFVKSTLEMKNDGQNTNVKLLTQKLQNSPLALQLAVAYIRQKDKESKILNDEFTIEDYLKYFEDEDGKREFLNIEFTKSSPIMYKKTIMKTCEISMEKIRLSEHGTEALHILNIMAFLAPNNVPLRMFLEMANIKDSNLAHVAQVLKQYSLLRIEDGLANIHQLVQEVIRMKMKDTNIEEAVIIESLNLLNEYTARTDMIAHWVSVWNYASKKKELVRQFSFFPNEIVKSFIMAVRYEDATLIGDKELSSLVSELGANDPDVLRMKSSLSHVMYCRGKYELALSSYREVLEQVNEVLGPEHRDALTIQNNIADIMLKKGKQDEALKLFKEVLVKRTKICGLNDPDTLTTQNSVACILHTQGKHNKAWRSFTSILKKRKKILGIDHIDTLITQKNIADVHSSQGKYGSALQSYHNVYKKEVKILGSEHPNTLTTRCNIANVLTRMRKHKKALLIYEDVLDKRIKMLDPDHPDILITLISTANELSNQGIYDKALPLFEDALEISCRVWGADDPKSFNIQHSIAEVLFNQGNWKYAISVYKQVMEKETQKWGIDHTSVLQTQFKIAEILQSQCKYDEALTLSKEVFQRQVARLGVDDSDTLKTRRVIAHILNNQGKHKKAFHMYREVYEAQKKIWGPDNEETVTTEKSLADALYKLGKYDEALQYFDETYVKQEKLFGPDHRETLNTVYNIACVLNIQKRYDEALSVYNEVYEKQKHILGYDHEETLNTRSDIADVMHRLDNYNDAIQVYKEILEIQDEILDADHPDILSTRYNIANVLNSQGKYDESLNMLREVHEQQSTIFGPNHEDTLNTLCDIADVLESLGRHDEASSVLKDISERQS